MTPGAIFLEGRKLTKRYGGVTVVDDVDIAVRHGEIRAVIGENGAGKSTVMKMLTGVIRPDSGEIRVEGHAVELRSPREAASTGIAIVHQELHLVPLLSVADNLMLVSPPAAGAVRRGSRAEKIYVRTILERIGLDVNPDTIVRALSIAQCQLLEIAKALALDAKAIVFDEPTAALLPAEAERLLALIETLRDEGKVILYVSHALDEVLRIADTISILRDGKLVGEWPRAEVDRDALIHAMVDRPVGLYAHKPAACKDEIVLAVTNLATRSIQDLTFELHAGEILGFAGLMGGGMQQAALALCGEDKVTTGSMVLQGKPVFFRSPRDAALTGVVAIPEERKREGIVADRSVLENLHLGRYRYHAKNGLLKPSRLRAAALELVRRFQVRLASIDQPIATLSGGNQQKVLLARCVQTKPRVLIISSPTRGVDIGAKDAIHEIVLDLAARGAAIVLISPEIEELLGLAHRIAVFSEGRMVEILSRADATPRRIMQLAVGSDERRKNAA